MRKDLEEVINHKVSIMKLTETELQSLTPSELKDYLIANLKELSKKLKEEAQRKDFKAKANFITNILIGLDDSWWKWFTIFMQCIKDDYRPYIWNLIITALTGEPLEAEEEHLEAEE